MKPDLFMNDFERTVWADAHYSVVGRALTFATRFEGLCRALHVYIGLEENKGILESEEEVIKLVNSLNKLKLVQHVTAIARDESELKNILDKGRLARNEMAHDLTIGLDRCIDILPDKHINKLMERLRELIIELAEADRAVSFIMTVVTHEPLPTNDFLAKYPQLIEKWVMEQDEI